MENMEIGATTLIRGSGLEAVDLQNDTSSMARRLPTRDTAMRGMQKLVGAFVEKPETILQELVNAAVDMCGAATLPG
jgi:hypothetical protein